LPQVLLRLLLCLCGLNYCRHRHIASDTTLQDVKFLENYYGYNTLFWLYLSRYSGLPSEASTASIVSFCNKYYSRNKAMAHASVRSMPPCGPCLRGVFTLRRWVISLFHARFYIEGYNGVWQFWSGFACFWKINQLNTLFV
jgi:hypothetical protein